jgi:hypothetical protein
MAISREIRLHRQPVGQYIFERSYLRFDIPILGFHLRVNAINGQYTG